MRQLIYCSVATEQPTTPDLEKLLIDARTRNTANDVTGLLLYCAGSYMQLLEGQEAGVEDIFASIAADPRHHSLRVLRHEDVADRLFADWSMGFEHIDESDLETHVPGYLAPGTYPLVNAAIVRDPVVAETLLRLYARGRAE